MAKPRKFYETLNQPQRSPNGTYRRPNPKAHGSADKQPGAWTRRPGAITYPTWATLQPIYPEPEPAPPIPYAGIRTGEITGYRAWKVVDEGNGPELCSLAHYQVWKPGEIIRGDVDQVVECAGIFNEHIIMGGVYAHAELDLVFRQTLDLVMIQFPVRLQSGPPGSTLLGLVYGTVELWGEVVEHDLGYRAEYAKVTSLTNSIGRYDFAKLKEQYGV